MELIQRKMLIDERRMKGPGKAKGIPIISTDREISGYFSLFFPSLHISAFQVAPFPWPSYVICCWRPVGASSFAGPLGSVASPTDSSHGSQRDRVSKKWRLDDPTQPKLRLFARNKETKDSLCASNIMQWMVRKDSETMAFISRLHHLCNAEIVNWS